jgi:hypothetical protein
MDNRSNTAIELAVQKGRVAATDDFPSALTSMAHDGVPKAVIERIFIYQQRCRSTDMGSFETIS